jgi:hypothetical protein
MRYCDVNRQRLSRGEGNCSPANQMLHEVWNVLMFVIMLSKGNSPVAVSPNSSPPGGIADVVNLWLLIALQLYGKNAANDPFGGIHKQKLYTFHFSHKMINETSISLSQTFHAFLLKRNIVSCSKPTGSIYSKIFLFFNAVVKLGKCDLAFKC